jgi:signal transduction histidine kinase
MKLGVSAEAQPGLAARLAWITAARLLFLLLLVGALSFFYLRGGLASYPDSMRVIFVTFGMGFGLTVVYAALLRMGGQTERVAYAQLVFDQVTWTAIVWVSGGVSSGATSLYGLTCVLGAILVGVRGAILAAVAGVGLYAMLAIGFATHLVLPPHDQPEYLGHIGAYPLLVNGLGVVTVAVLAGYLAERLRTTGGALAEATRRYTEAEQLAHLGRLASWLAHEIRNPLGSIRGSIEMLRESAALGEEERALCGIVEKETARLNDLVGDMLDLSRSRKPVAEAVDIAALAQDVVALATRSSSVTVSYDGPSSAIARCDGAQMRQVAWNLVRNALQAAPSGSSVTVHVEKSDGRVVFSVRDRGPGIEQKDAERIFDTFYTTRTHGAGIGLAVVKKIIDDHAAMGATIAVEEGDGGRGACFRVTLRADVTGLRTSLAPKALRA